MDTRLVLEIIITVAEELLRRAMDKQNGRQKGGDKMDAVTALMIVVAVAKVLIERADKQAAERKKEVIRWTQ